MGEAQVFWDDDAEKCGRITAKRVGDKLPGANGGGEGQARLCRCCSSKDHKTLVCTHKKVVCKNFEKTGTYNFGDECMHLHIRGGGGTGEIAPPTYQQARKQVMPPVGSPEGWVPPDPLPDGTPPNTSLVVAKEAIHWTAGKVVKSTCRGAVLV